MALFTFLIKVIHIHSEATIHKVISDIIAAKGVNVRDKFSSSDEIHSTCNFTIGRTS